MSNDQYWRAISVDSVSPEHFPSVALYVRNGPNYVLYKDAESKFTVADYSRLTRNFTKFFYVRSGDFETIKEFMEQSLAEMLSRDDLSNSAKGRILFQTSVNCVIDLFESPEMTPNQLRCRNMVQHMLQYVIKNPHALESLKTVAAHNFYFFVHAVQVTALSLLVHGTLYNLDHDEMVDVGIGSLIHDYGMIFITSEILEKNDALTDIEYYNIKQHPQKGYEFLKLSGNYNEVVLNIVRYHHERYDGSGYPTGMMGNDIPRSGQVTGLCDVYSALIMDRAQRKANSHADAIRIMREEGQNGAFKPELLDAFVEIVNEMNPA